MICFSFPAQLKPRLFAVLAVLIVMTGSSRWMALTAGPGVCSPFSPGNLVLSRSTYSAAPGLITVGQTLPGAAAAAFTATGVNLTSGVVASTSIFIANGQVQITTGGMTYTRTLTTVVTDSVAKTTTLTWSVALPSAVVKNDTILPLAVVDATYPGVWANEAPDPSFGITSPILLDQMGADATVLDTCAVDPTKMVTSFSSKSELGLSLSPDGSKLTFMGYTSPENTLDVSNSNTAGHFDSTNPVPSTFAREVGQLDSSATVTLTPVNTYSGNNGRGAIAANGLFYMVGNAGNGSGTEPIGIIDNTGLQVITPGDATGNSTVIGIKKSVCTPTVPKNGCQFGFATGDIGLPADKSGKDDNFRGITVFGNTIYVTKGSGSNGIDTVYQVGTPGSLPSLAAGASTPISVLSGLPTVLATNANNASIYPFAMWFADANTLYVADEGYGNPTTTSVPTPYAGLQKWVFSNGQWGSHSSPNYVLQGGLNLGQTYSVAGYDPSLFPATGGLRNLTGRRNDDGTVTIWAVTSTTSANTDQGADPNQLVVITDKLSNTDASVATGESFTILKTAGFGEVFRGVSFSPGTINPTWVLSALPAANGFGWNNTNVTVTATASLSDPTQSIQSVYYSLTGAQNTTASTAGNSAAPVVSAEGDTTVTFYALNSASSQSPTRSVSLMIDKTPPSIVFTGDAGTYTVDQIINITCTPSDALSGLASSSCPGASGPAYTFAVGPHTLNASATDRAGNQTNTSASFTVSVTFDSLANLTGQFVSQHGIANSLQAKLSAAASSTGRGNSSSKAGQLGAYVNELNAQSGKALTAEQAAILIQLASYL